MKADLTKPSVPSVPSVEVLEGSDAPGDAPELFGLRVNWQPESERIEAAEFLIATRHQEHARRRVAAALLSLRTQNRADLARRLARRPGEGPAA